MDLSSSKFSAKDMDSSNWWNCTICTMHPDSGCIAPKPSPDPVLTPSHENPVHPQGATGGGRRAGYESAASGRRVPERLSGAQGAHLWESADRDANKRVNGLRRPT